MRDMKLQQAIRWISHRLRERPAADRSELVDAASQEFDLTPKQEEFLYHMYLKAA